VRNVVIRLYYRVIQYNGNLKTERYDDVQVVLLSSLFKLYQEFIHEGDQKYGNGDISEGSLVSCRSKDDMAGRRATTFIIHKTATLKLLIFKSQIKGKVLVSRRKQVTT